MIAVVHFTIAFEAIITAADSNVACGHKQTSHSTPQKNREAGRD